MHSKIFQISNKPIDREAYVTPSDFYESCEPWADYVGEPVDDADEIREYVKGLADCMKGVLTLNDDNTLTYLGEEKLREFKQEWVDYLRSLVIGLTADNILTDQNLWRIEKAVERSHVDRCSRFYIDAWNGWAGPMQDFIEFIDHSLKKGDRIYVGAIIDFHW